MFLGFICFCPINCDAQFEVQFSQLQTIEKENVKLIQNVSFPMISQKPHDLYIYPEWIMGWLRLKGESEMIPVMTRLNILSGTVELMCRNQIRILKTNAVDMVTIGARIFIPDASSPSSYFEILSHGKINLLGAHQLRLSNEGNALYPSSTNVEKKSTAKLVYYFSKDGEKAEALKTKKKKILVLMENNENAKQFIETENLKLSKKKHLVKLFDFYNAL